MLFLFSRHPQISSPLLNQFFLFFIFGWGGRGSEDHRKKSWVDLNSVCRSKEVGGLGVRRISEFNYALLGKWCWRMLVDRDSLWFKAMSARYGLTKGRLGGGGRHASLLWRDMEVLSREEWFQDSDHRVVGNGEKTLFWSDVWVGDRNGRNSHKKGGLNIVTLLKLFLKLKLSLYTQENSWLILVQQINNN